MCISLLTKINLLGPPLSTASFAHASVPLVELYPTQMQKATSVICTRSEAMADPSRPWSQAVARVASCRLAQCKAQPVGYLTNTELSSIHAMLCTPQPVRKLASGLTDIVMQWLHLQVHPLFLVSQLQLL